MMKINVLILVLTYTVDCGRTRRLDFGSLFGKIVEDMNKCIPKTDIGLFKIVFRILKSFEFRTAW